jgi:hypothetical protein
MVFGVSSREISGTLECLQHIAFQSPFPEIVKRSILAPENVPSMVGVVGDNNGVDGPGP